MSTSRVVFVVRVVGRSVGKGELTRSGTKLVHNGLELLGSDGRTGQQERSV